MLCKFCLQYIFLQISRKLPSLVMLGQANIGKTTRARLALSIASSPDAFLAGQVRFKLNKQYIHLIYTIYFVNKITPALQQKKSPNTLQWYPYGVYKYYFSVIECCGYPGYIVLFWSTCGFGRHACKQQEGPKILCNANYFSENLFLVFIKCFVHY